MKKLISFFLLIFLFNGCEKENQQTTVRYRVSNAFANTEISYRNDREQLISQEFPFESGEDVWTWTGQLKQGEIVYLSARYADTASSVKLQILIDGKIYKEGSSNHEPNKFLIVSGTVPYN